jgi:hypothetical protein
MGPCLRRHRRLGRKRRCDNGDVVADQIGSHLRQTIIVLVDPFSAMATSFFASALAIARMA